MIPVEKLPAHREHIPADRLWAYLKADGEMTLPDRVHVATCDDCEEVFLGCLY
jgi:hypothetical protein